jgi:hypothetical protein
MSTAVVFPSDQARMKGDKFSRQREASPNGKSSPRNTRRQGNSKQGNAERRSQSHSPTPYAKRDRLQEALSGLEDFKAQLLIVGRPDKRQDPDHDDTTTFSTPIAQKKQLLRSHKSWEHPRIRKPADFLAIVRDDKEMQVLLSAAVLEVILLGGTFPNSVLEVTLLLE